LSSSAIKVAAYNAANKLTLVRHATGVVVPPTIAKTPDMVNPVGSDV